MITVDIEGVSMLAVFKVIEIVNDNNTYPALVGIDWSTDMKGVINQKKRKMIFEKNSLCIVVPFVGIYRVSSSDKTPKDTAHKHITDQYTSILDVVKTLKEGRNPWPEPTRPL